jgi:hypothetical protein
VALKAARATVLGGLAGFQRELIRARTGEGLKRQRPRGQVRSTSEDDPASAPGGAAAPCCWRDYGRCGADLAVDATTIGRCFLGLRETPYARRVLNSEIFRFSIRP